LSIIIVGHQLCSCDLGASFHRYIEGEVKEIGEKGAVARGYFSGNALHGYANADDETYYWHTVRVIQHELAHNYGARHCNRECIMNVPEFWDVHRDLTEIWCDPCKTTMIPYINKY